MVIERETQESLTGLQIQLDDFDGRLEFAERRVQSIRYQNFVDNFLQGLTDLSTLGFISSHLDWKHVESPTNPDAGFQRLFADTDNSGHLTSRNSSGTEIDLEYGDTDVDSHLNTSGFRLNDNVKGLFGTGSDASIFFNGTDMIIDPTDGGASVGDVIINVDGDSDSGALAFGAAAGGDARIYYDGTNLVIDPDAVGSGVVSVAGDLHVDGGVGIGPRVTQALATNRFLQLGNNTALSENSTIAQILMTNTPSSNDVQVTALQISGSIIGTGKTGLDLSGVGISPTALFGTFDTVIGLKISPAVNSAVVTTATALIIDPSFAGSAGSGEAYGIHIKDIAGATSGFDDVYALRIVDQTAGDNNTWYISQEGTTGVNRFEAKTHIGGTAIPAVALQVTGIATIEGTGNPIDLTNNTNSASLQLAAFRGGARVGAADNDEMFLTFFLSTDTTAQEYGRVTVIATDVTNTTKAGGFQIELMQNNTLRDYMHFAATAGADTGLVEFNAGQVDIDLKVRGDGIENLLFVNAGTDRVGIGTNTPVAPFELVVAAAVTDPSPFRITPTSGEGGIAVHFIKSGANEFSGFAFGLHWDGSNWIADANTASQLQKDGQVGLLLTADDGLTAGNSFSPTSRLRIFFDGNIAMGANIANSSTFLKVVHPDTTGFCGEFIQSNADNTSVGFSIDIAATASGTNDTKSFGGFRALRRLNTAGEGIGAHFALLDSGSAVQEYAGIAGVIETNTAGSEDGALIIVVTDGGSQRQEKVRVNKTGVGIGRTATANALEVNGDALIDSREVHRYAYSVGG